MTHKELYDFRKGYFQEHHKYGLHYYKNVDFSLLSKICYRKRTGRGSNNSVNEVVIMGDTETSKKDRPYINKDRKSKQKSIVYENHVVAWTISIRAYDMNIWTLYGHRPSEMVECIKLMLEAMPGDDTIMYFHNLAYDWTFLRRFLFREFGLPEKQLNTKSHYPILIKFENGLILKDSLILAQRNLEKWAKDLNVEHQKAKGKWDYDKIRNQFETTFTDDELEYIEHDTLAGVECIDAMLHALNKNIATMPYTATGIPREDVRNIAKENNGRNLFERICMTFEEYIIATMVYHGGFTHGNRHLIDVLVEGSIQCRDFSSSYPFCMIAFKFPMGGFTKLSDKMSDFIIEQMDDYAFMFKLIAFNVRLKDDLVPMPALQHSKCVQVYNPIVDNGRVLKADYLEIYLTELDLDVIKDQYIWEKHICTDVYAATKDYLPRWFTDYIFSLYEDKTKLKGGDAVLYALAKAKLNSVYGMCVQKCVRETIDENYQTGEYTVSEDYDPKELYEKYLKNYNSVLPYQWGVWVTAYAFHNIFKLGKCVDYENGGEWIYTDTDSCYSNKWNLEKLEAYNDSCKEKLRANGYGPVIHNGREYWLGIAELDGTYTEYKTLGAKRYCGRSAEDGELHITVAGVPKSGAKCLEDNIDNFTKGFVFPGAETGKLTHTYIYVDDIYIDENGNETGDSIDLSPCDYLLDSVAVIRWEDLVEEEIEVQVYG